MSYLDNPMYETKNASSEAVVALFQQEMSGLRDYQDTIPYTNMAHDKSDNPSTKQMAIRSRKLLIATPETSQANRATNFGIPFRPASEAMIASQAVNGVRVLEAELTTSKRDLLVAKSETSQATRATTFDVPFRLVNSEAMTVGQTVNCLLEDERTTSTSTAQHSMFSINDAIPANSIAPRTGTAVRVYDINSDVVFVDNGVFAFATGARITNFYPQEMTATHTDPSPGPKNQNREREANPQGRVTKNPRPARKPANKRGRRRRPFYVGDESDAWSTTATVDGPISDFHMKDASEKAESSDLAGAATACKEKREKGPIFKNLVWVREGLEPKPSD